MPDLSAAAYVDQVRQILAVTEPELDTGIGSVVRKIIDAFGEVQASANADQRMLDYLFNLDAKSGADLDDFLLTFSMTRIQSKRATGVITFSRPAAATDDIPIPPNTMVTTATATPITFATTTSAILPKGQSSIDLPVQAVAPGTSGNLPANSLTRMASPTGGISTVNNLSPTSGGTDTESDAQFRSRFKRTVFRQMAGTEGMFIGTALEDSDVGSADDVPVTQALVLGASSRWREQVQIAGDGTATSTIPPSNVKYIFNGTQFFGGNIDGGDILTPGVHYTFDTTVTPPRIVGIGSALTPGDIYDLDFEYSSSASRNDPANGITNRVDVWVTGQRLTEATETVYLRYARAFTALAGNSLTVDDFVRADTAGAHPAAGNYFVALAFGPIVSIPDVLVLGGTTYHEGTDYWLVHNDTAFGYGPNSLFGIEWLSSHAPPDGTAIDLSGSNSYIYNAVPRDVEQRIRRWRLVGFDSRAHAVKQVQLRLNLAIQFDPLAPQSQVIDNVTLAMEAYFAARGFDAVVQVSDLLQAVHNVIGVDNVRFLTSYESGADRTPVQGYGIQQVTSAGTVIKTYATPNPALPGEGARATDLVLGDNEVPVLHDVQVVVKAQNTFGTM